MKSFAVQISKFLFLTLLLISPMIAFSFFSPAQSLTNNSVLISPANAETHQSQPAQSPIQSDENKFAILIAQSPHQQVLGVQEINKEISEEIKPEDENNTPKSLSGTYTIALLGDSMIDVMQPDLPQLASVLKEFYPQAKFKLLNYGVGASSIDYGITRLTTGYTYLDQNFSSLLSQNPDIIVVESFAYNHWGNNQSDLNRQWLALGKIVETIKNQSQAKIVLAATVGPNETTLCDGIDGMNLSSNQKQEKAQTIRAYLQNLINFAGSQNYPLADAYHASLNNQGNGKSVYVNAGDHLHPSDAGKDLFAQKIAEAIYENNLL